MPTAYTNNFILEGAVTLTQHMLVYPEVTDKTFDGTTTATVNGLLPDVTSVAPPVVLESTHEKALKYVSLAQLREFAWAPH